MEHRKERNEFGLDEYNALDVQKERAKDALPWLVVVVGLLAIAALAISTDNVRNLSLFGLGDRSVITLCRG